MKINTITCHHSYNHGAMLQAYALAHYLQSLGHDVSIIDYKAQYMSNYKINFKWVPQRYDHFCIRCLYRLIKKKHYIMNQMRHDSLEFFFNEHMPITPSQYRSILQLRENPPEAELYIAGSDQIWNTTHSHGLDPAFYLDFGTPKRKISYAASFATTELKDGSQDFVREKLSNFDAISVREHSAITILESLGYKGDVVVDPVLLLKQNEWDELIKHETGEGEDYILTYDFEHRDSPLGVIAKRLARLYGCKIYSVSSNKRRYEDKSFFACSPEDFISMIKHARCVVSNSFHGTVFSMIYGKDFFVVNRKDGLNERMHDLLDHYGLQERLVSPDTSDDTLMRSIDYDRIKISLTKDIDFSKSFLQHQIELVQ